MHFSIPETSDQKDPKAGSPYTTYVVHINGVRHCNVRFRQLHTLNEQLRREFHPSTIPSFPPKKLLPLSHAQIEERRICLEKYLQLLSQDPRIANSITFNGFLLAAQQETRAEKTEDVNLDVFLMNEQKISIRGLSILQTEEVLERVCQQLQVPDEYVYYFALFLLERKEDGEFVIVRKLQDFESPYISQKSASHGTLKLVLRKACWDPKIDMELFNHKVTLNLLYTQTIAEVERGWILANPETKRQLARLQAMGSKYEYMHTAHRLPFYGYLQFLPCICDYPMTNTPAHVVIGNRELIMKIRTPKGELKEGSFKVTKMRCWRIMTLADGLASDEFNDSDPEDSGAKLELSFEYLMSNQELQWITIISPQAILMSLCLQSIVEELLRIRSGIPIKKAGEKSCSTDYLFQRKDGVVQKFPIRSGLHAAQHNKCSNGTASIPKIDPKTLASLTGRQYSVKKLSEKFDVVNFRDASRAAEDVLIENEAFFEMKDEDFRAKVPDSVHILMLSQVFGHVILVPGQNVHHTSGQVARIEYLVHIQGQQGVTLTGHDHNGVGTANGRGEEGHETEQRILFRTSNGQDAHWLVDLDDRPIELGLLNSSAVLVGIGRPVEKTLNRLVHLGQSVLQLSPGEVGNLGPELLLAQLEVLGQVEEDLSPVESGSLLPARLGLQGCLHGIAHILSVGFTHLSHDLAFHIAHGRGIIPIRSLLSTTIVELVGVIHWGHGLSFISVAIDGRAIGQITGGKLLDVHINRSDLELALPLGLDVLKEALFAAIATIAALLVASKSSGGIKQIVAIDPHGPGLDVLGCLQGQGQLLRMHRTSEAVHGVVSHCDSLLGRAEGHGHEHGAKDLLHDHPGGSVHVGDQRRRVIAALGAIGLEHLGPLFAGLVHKGLDAGSLALAHDGPHVRGLVQGVTNAEMSQARLELPDEPLKDGLLDQELGTSGAHLALIEPDGVDHRLDGRVQVGALIDNDRTLAAQLERDLLARAGNGLPEHLADLSRAGEAHLVHVGMLSQGLTHGPTAGHHVEHAGWESSLGADLGEEQSRETGDGGRFEHDGVAHGQGRCHFPGHEHEGKVPGHDGPYHAHRLPVAHLLVHKLSPAGIVVQVADDNGNVGIAGLPDGLAIVQGLNHTNQTGVLLHVAGYGIDVPGPGVTREGLPGRQGPLGRGHSRAYVLGIALDRGCQNLARGRHERLVILPTLGLDPGIVDEVAEAALVILEPGLSHLIRLSGGSVVHAGENIRHRRIHLLGRDFHSNSYPKGEKSGVSD
eukprot:maker-scaffold1048_size67263-snap-gene-0.22 protein:Tk10016 transcript:maker-scaffold1048_size67263-snap-gene-0.22-mRNA-1 annotation:"sorting nexin-17"